MASWPWEKRWLYYDSLQAVALEDQMAMDGHSTEMPSDVSPGDVPGNMPTGGLSMGGGTTGTTKNVPPAVAKHENVIKSQSH